MQTDVLLSVVLIIPMVHYFLLQHSSLIRNLGMAVSYLIVHPYMIYTVYTIAPEMVKDVALVGLSTYTIVSAILMFQVAMTIDEREERIRYLEHTLRKT